MRTSPFLIAAVAAAASTCPASDIWDEAVDGDLSDDRFAPTALVLSPGTNSLSALSIQGDPEYVRLDVPDGMFLSEINLAFYHALSTVSFIGVQAGTVMTVDPDDPDAADLLGWVHFGPTLVGTDILDNMGRGAGAIGFTPPLGSGPYTYWIQETDDSPAAYRMDFVVIPAPGAAAALVLAAVAAARRRR